MFESILPILSIKIVPYNIFKFLFVETAEVDLPSAMTARGVTEYPFGLDRGT